MAKFSAMAKLRKFVLLAFTLALGAGELRAASFGENHDYRAAVNSFNVGTWSHAETELGKFVTNYPKSDRRGEVILLQAQARFFQTNLSGAITLLESNLDRAEGRADEYRFWIAEAQYQKGDYPAAAEAYAKFLNLHAASARRLGALVGEAAARAQLGQWPQVTKLLGRSDGEFGFAVRTSLTNELVARGLLLLGEAYLSQTNLEPAKVTLAPLAGLKLDGALAWRGEHLRGQAQRAGGKLAEALTTSSNLVSLAGNLASGRARALAESVATQAGILDALGRRDEAVAVWKQNFATNAPEARQREALLEVARIQLAQEKFAEIGETLAKFLAEHTNAPASDAALLTLGEIQLKQTGLLTATNSAGANGDTNQLERALAYFDRLLKTFPDSAFAGKAELDRGWCYWLRSNWGQSEAAFARAAARLREPPDLAVARFKLADAQFAQGNFSGARDNYRATLDLVARLPQLNGTLRAPALRQLLHACDELNDQAGADQAMSGILQLPLETGVLDGSLLFRAQGHLDHGRPGPALEEFKKFISLFPGSTNRPEAELLIARTFEQQADWGGAITNYEQWLERNPNHPLRPRAEFQRAWATYQAGNETNALGYFSNFVTAYATNELAPQAQWWVAHHHFRQKDYLAAEIDFKVLIEKWPQSELADEARLMAGRAAVGRQGYDNAIEQFTALTKQKVSNPLWAQAVFAYGDVLMIKPAAGGETNRAANFREALRVFGKIHEQFPTNEMAALAWGEMAKCYRQLQDPTNAVMALTKVIESPVAKISARSEAQVGLGVLQEELARNETGDGQKALLKSAADNYLDVVFEKNLREGETRDLYWVKKAGLEAVRLLDNAQDWETEVKLCRKLQELLPVSNAIWQLKVEAATSHLADEKK